MGSAEKRGGVGRRGKEEEQEKEEEEEKKDKRMIVTALTVLMARVHLGQRSRKKGCLRLCLVAQDGDRVILRRRSK